MNETQQLAQFVTETRFSDLSSEVVEKAKGLILDQLGCQLAFAFLPWNQQIYQYVRGKGVAGGPCTVVYYGLKTGPEEAAFANGTFGHGFEMDDVEMITTSHPGVVVIPPALAVAADPNIARKG